MHRGIMFIVMSSLLAPLGATAAPRKASPPASKQPAMPKLMQSCDAHKFETVVHAVVDGEPRDSKVKLCGVEGQSDADWIKTLRDAIGKLEANKEIAAAVRDQIVTAIQSEISRLVIVGSVPRQSRKATEVVSAAAIPLSRDYSSLPPLPPQPEATEAPAPPARTSEVALPPARETHSVPIQQEYAQLPPLPVTPAPVPVQASIRPTPIPAVAPRLTFGCDTPGEITSDAPCADFQRDTMLTIHARDDVPAGMFLQFVRNDQSQAKVALDGLRRGRALRTALPREVCSGFTSGKLELRIVRGESGSEVLATDGPYSLRC
jgi:hypothetical protein